VVAVDARSLQRPGIGFYVVVRGMLDELVGAGFAVALVTDDAAHAQALEADYPNAEVALLPRTTWLWWEQVQVARWLWRRQPAVWVAPANYGVPLWHRRSTKCLLVVHDVIPLLYPRVYLTPRPLWGAMYLVSLAISALSADKVVAVSDCTAADVRRLCRRSAVVAHPPVPTGRGRPPGPAPRAGRYVVYNGGFDSRKNVPALLDAMVAFRATPEGADVSLVVMGDRPEIARAMLAGHPLEGAVEVTGFVSDEQKWSYLSHALAVVYPSSYEGFGLVATEAFAAGVPLVSGTGGALREVGGEAAIFCDPHRQASLVRALRAAAEPTARAQAVKKGYGQLEKLRARSGGYARLVGELVPKPGGAQGTAQPERRAQLGCRADRATW
jgi:glycosyltransferase involved in cell wall biosynthesis